MGHGFHGYVTNNQRVDSWICFSSNQLLTPGGTVNLLFVFTFSTSRNWMELGKRWTSIQGPYFSGDFNTSENMPAGQLRSSVQIMIYSII